MTRYATSPHTASPRAVLCNGPATGVHSEGLVGKMTTKDDLLHIQLTLLPLIPPAAIRAEARRQGVPAFILNLQYFS